MTERSEYQKLSEHLSVLGIQREQFADGHLSDSFGMAGLTEKRCFELLLRGQAQIMGALAIFARDYDPMLGVLTTGDPPPINEDLIFKDYVSDNVAATHSTWTDRLAMNEMKFPEPTSGYQWRLWTGAGPSATPGVVERPTGLSEGDGDPWHAPTVRVRLRDGRVHMISQKAAEWRHLGRGHDIIAYEEPIPGD